jgi:hypothetical protein
MCSAHDEQHNSAEQPNDKVVDDIGYQSYEKSGVMLSGLGLLQELFDGVLQGFFAGGVSFCLQGVLPGLPVFFARMPDQGVVRYLFCFYKTENLVQGIGALPPFTLGDGFIYKKP